MDDPWGSNAWSTPSEEGQDVSKRSVVTRWTAFERDADEETADVAAPTWSEVTEPMWDGGVNLWNASSSTQGEWKPPASPRPKSDEGGEDQMSEASQETAAVSAGNAVLEHTVRIPSPRPILPTPPLSPPPVFIPRSHSPPVEEVAPPEVQLVSQDPFGSFESAETADKDLLDEPWSSGATEFPPEATEPWGNTWSTTAEERNKFTRDDADEWELAQEAKRKRDRKVPPELLSSLLAQWETVADEIYGKVSSDSEDFFSWRNGLDNVENLSELMETFLPPASFPLPVPLSKTRLSKSVKDALRLTRSFAMTQSSPMARLYASKGSTDWERAVQSQNTSAQDNWGWDLKYELEVEKEKGGEKEKRSTGFLSLWGRKSSTLPNSSPVPEINSPSITKPPGVTLPLNPSPPLASTRTSIDTSSGAPSDIPVQQEIISLPAPTTIDSATTMPNEAPSSQPSAMSRFWNKLSKRASTPLPGISDDKEKGKHSSLQQVSLSADELSFLSDVPSGMSSKPQATVDSIEAMLTMPSKTTSSKLPPPLAPPPSFVSTPPIQNSAGNHRSVDGPERQKIHAPLTDLLDSAALGYGGGGKGYASVLFDPLESPKKNEQLLPNSLRSSSSPLGPVMTVSSPLPRPPTSHSTQSMAFRNLLDKRLEQSRSEYSPPVPLLRPPVGHTSRTNLSSERMSLSSSPVLQPPVGSTLLPTPMKASDSRGQLSDFIPGSSPDHRTSSSPFDMPARSTTFAFAGSLVAAPAESDIGDFGDFGDFVSTSPLPPEPSKLAQSISALSFAQSASGRPGDMAGSVGGAISNAGRLSVGTPPPRIAPPPGSSAMAAGRQKTVDFLDDDFTTVDLSVPTSKAKPFFPLSSKSQSSSPTISPLPVTAQRGKPTGQSGLSAQDLSFFEGL